MTRATVIRVRTPDATYVGSTTAHTASFRGIRYAMPISGERRWCGPVTELPSGDIDARSPGQACWQGVMALLAQPPLWRSAVAEGDDCLKLNIVTPCVTPDEPMPVLVWFHGGGLLVGDASGIAAAAGRLARFGIVVVTANYRLGYAGWLDLSAFFPELADSDNRGLRDQIAALSWVQHHIDAFGGDPERITVAGHSAGACTTLALLTSPARSVPVRRAALFSPTGAAFVAQADQKPVAEEFLHRLGVRAGDVDALSKVLPRNVIDAQNRIETAIRRSVSQRRFGPVTRRNWGAGIAIGTATVPCDPVAALRDGAAAGIDLLIGTTAEEWRSYSAGGVPTNVITTPYLLNAFTGHVRGHRSMIRSARRMTSSRRELNDELFTELVFRRPARAVADAHSRHGTTFLYRTCYAAEGSLRDAGAGHGVDLPLWWGDFESPLGRAVGSSVRLRDGADVLATTLAEFIHRGVPRAQWPPHTASQPHEEWLGGRPSDSRTTRRMRADR